MTYGALNSSVIKRVRYEYRIVLTCYRATAESMRGVVDTSRDVLPGTAVRLAPALVAVAVPFRGAARRCILGSWRFFGASAGESEALRLSGRPTNDDGLRASSEVKDEKGRDRVWPSGSLTPGHRAR